MEITYNRVETHISDYRSGLKNREEDVFVKLEKNTRRGIIEVELHGPTGVTTYLSTLSGENNLKVQTVTNDENKTVISEGHFLNSETKDAIFQKSFQGKGIQIEAIQSDLNDRVVSLKIIRDTVKDIIIAVVQEVHYTLSEEEFNRSIKK